MTVTEIFARLKNADAEYDRKRHTTKRACGSCALCCKIMEVVPEVKPDKHDWCKHAQPKSACGGCAIYAHRPEVCRDFHCMWLVDVRLPDYWFPSKSKIVVNPKLVNDKVPVVAFIVDPDYPTRWREEPYFSDIKKLAAAGLDGRIGQKWTTVVIVGDERIPIGN